jgi:hypothetical protein
MKYMRLVKTEQQELLADLERMPEWLDEVFAGLSPEDAATPGPDGGFSPVAQCWHLADLEREAFAVRIERLLTEVEPALPDFDGAQIAAQRRYHLKSLAEGIAAFRRARHVNLAMLRAIPAGDWTRGGTQEGVGRVSLCDLPSLMAEHDLTHRGEIEAWRKPRGAV